MAETKSITKNFKAPDEVREFSRGVMNVVRLGPDVVGLGTFQPGWRWSQDVKPKAGGHSCQVAHSLFCISGRMTIKMDGGEELRLGPGEAAYIAPGHDAWVEGPEACIAVDWAGARTYAK
jgi:mannose-6-phosphate isomerase-like protein (cupin superfamily)